MTEMVTIQQSFDVPAYDAHLEQSKQQEKKQEWHRKQKFEPPRFRSRVFTGREEINYENI